MFFSCGVLVGFGVRVILASWDELGNVLSSSVFRKLWGLGLSLLYVFDGIQLWNHLVLGFCWDILLLSIKSLTIGLFKFLLQVSFDSLCFWNLSFHLGYLICWCTIVHSFKILSLLFVEAWYLCPHFNFWF